MKHIKTVTKSNLKDTLRTGGCRGMPDVMPIGLQNVVHARKPEVRKEKLIF